MSYLSGESVGRHVFQKHRGDFLVSLLGGDVERGVQVLCGGVGRCIVLQQQHHIVHISQARRDVKGGLLFLGEKTVLLS